MDYADIDPPRGRASRSPRSPSPAPRRATPSRSPLRNRSRSPVRDGDEDRRMRDRSPPRFRDRSPPRGASYGRDREPLRAPIGPPPPRPAHAPENPDPTNVVGVFGLSIRTTEPELHKVFDDIAPVEKVVIVYDARSERSRGFGFITMKDTAAAEKVIKALNGLDLHGRRLRVDFSVTKRPHEPTPGEYRGNLRDGDMHGGYPPRGPPGGYDRYGGPPRGDYGPPRGYGPPPGGFDSRYGPPRGYGPPPPRGDDWGRPAPPRGGGWERGPGDYNRPPPPRRDGPDSSEDWRRRPSPPRRRSRSRSPARRSVRREDSPPRRLRDDDDDFRAAPRRHRDSPPDARQESRPLRD